MSSFETDKRHLRELLIYFINFKKCAAKAHRLLVETYCEAALRWFYHETKSMLKSWNFYYSFFNYFRIHLQSFRFLDHLVIEKLLIEVSPFGHELLYSQWQWQVNPSFKWALYFKIPCYAFKNLHKFAANLETFSAFRKNFLPYNKFLLSFQRL